MLSQSKATAISMGRPNTISENYFLMLDLCSPEVEYHNPKFMKQSSILEIKYQYGNISDPEIVKQL